MAKRLSQSFIDKLLLGDAAEKKCLGRLLATGVFDRYELWLEAEEIDNPDKAVNALQATVSFAVLLIGGLHSDFFRNNAETRGAVTGLVESSLRRVFDDQH